MICQFLHPIIRSSLIIRKLLLDKKPLTMFEKFQYFLSVWFWVRTLPKVRWTQSGLRRSGAQTRRTTTISLRLAINAEKISSERSAHSFHMVSFHSYFHTPTHAFKIIRSSACAKQLERGRFSAVRQSSRTTRQSPQKALRQGLECVESTPASCRTAPGL